PGMRTSRIKQVVPGKRADCRKSSPEANPSALNPIDLRRLWRASRTDSSSSTIAMNAWGPRSPSFPLVRFPRELFFIGEEIAQRADRNLLYVGIDIRWYR